MKAFITPRKSGVNDQMKHQTNNGMKMIEEIFEKMISCEVMSENKEY